MTAPWWIEMRTEQLLLELRELLVRFDENLAAHHLMQECVPYYLDDASHPLIARAREDQARMVDHIVGDSYADYYETNVHERPFEEQYGIEPEVAHEHLHRVRFLRRWLEEQDDTRFPHLNLLSLLDCACNDGWMAKNLEGLVLYRGLDLNPHCLERAGRRKVPDALFVRAAAEDAATVLPLRVVRYDVVVAFELIEHVKDPDVVLAAMVACARPGGALFVSTPLGACSGGDLPDWWLVEPKGHVRCYTPRTFAALLDRHGTVEEIQVSTAQDGQQLMVARVTTPG